VSDILLRTICNGILRYSWGEDVFSESLGTQAMSKKLVICKKSSEKMWLICNYEIRHETCDECELIDFCLCWLLYFTLIGY